MPVYIVTLKPEATVEDVKAAKKKAIDQGGKIEHEYSIIKGFSVRFNDATVNCLTSDPNVQAVELDSGIKIQ